LRSRSNFYAWIIHSKVLESDMLDVTFIVAGVAFFLLAVLYTYACDRL
jgi:hypothetical protein